MTFTENNSNQNNLTTPNRFSLSSTSLPFGDEIRSNIKAAINTVKTESPFLYWVVLLHLFLGLVSIGGIMIDDRTLMGVNVWIKPLKFCISGGIYIFTLGYLLNYYPYSPRKKSVINNIVAFTLGIEVLIIVYQGARAVMSHYNQSNIFDGVLFGLMGILIAINVLIMVLLIFDTIRLKLKTTKSMQWAILIGWLIVFFGSWIGGQMIGQMSHSVGVADGGEGLPLVNWSTKGGDLRIAHFFGLHGIQIIPLFALWMNNKWKNKTSRQIIAISVFALLYAGWIGFTFYQAKQGIPLIR